MTVRKSNYLYVSTCHWKSVWLFYQCLMQWVSPPISQRALLLLLCSYVFLAETVTLAAPCLALIYHWCYANIAGHGYSAVDHTGLRHCSGRGWVCGLKGWPAPPPTHSTVVKGCWLKHEFRKATRHTRWFIRLLHWLCVCLFFLNIVFSYYLLFGFMATMIKYSLLCHEFTAIYESTRMN